MSDNKEQSVALLAVSAAAAGAILGGAIVGLLFTSQQKIKRVPYAADHRLRPYFSQAVVHNGVATLSGQVGSGKDVAEQTCDIFGKIDALLKELGTSKENIIGATVWLADIKKDFPAFNAVWKEYVAEFPDSKPARATTQAQLASPSFLVEIQVTARI